MGCVPQHMVGNAGCQVYVEGQTPACREGDVTVMHTLPQLVVCKGYVVRSSALKLGQVLGCG